MDRIAIAVLRAELEADCVVVSQAARCASERFGEGRPEQLEACAFQLARLYNAVEQLGLRIAKAFENNIDDERGWHVELLRRLALEIPGVRPAPFGASILPALQDLRGFRHVVRHAYDLELRKEKVLPVVEAAERVAAELPGLCHAFLDKVADEVS
jgi:hypothetical protein